VPILGKYVGLLTNGNDVDAAPDVTETLCNEVKLCDIVPAGVGKEVGFEEGKVFVGNDVTAVFVTILFVNIEDAADRLDDSRLLAGVVVDGNDVDVDDVVTTHNGPNENVGSTNCCAVEDVLAPEKENGVTVCYSTKQNIYVMLHSKYNTILFYYQIL